MNNGQKQLVGSGELYVRSYRAFKDNFCINLLLGVFIVLPQTIVSWSFGYYTNLPDVTHRPDFISTIFGFLIVELISLAIGSIALITLISDAHIRISGEIDLFWALGNGFDKLFSLWWIAILASLWTIGGFLLFIIPGFIVAIRLIFGNYVLVLESRYGLDALRRSRDLVRGYTFQTLIRWLAAYFPIIAVALVSYFLKPLFPKTNEIIYLAVNVLAAPFITIYGYFLYKELVALRN